jgi:hypothetical protein
MPNRAPPQHAALPRSARIWTPSSTSFRQWSQPGCGPLLAPFVDAPVQELYAFVLRSLPECVGQDPGELATQQAQQQETAQLKPEGRSKRVAGSRRLKRLGKTA